MEKPGLYPKAAVRGVLAVVAASLCYGVMPIISKTLLSGGLPPEFAARLEAFIGRFTARPFTLPETMLQNELYALKNESVVGFGMLFGCVISLLLLALGSKRGGKPLLRSLGQPAKSVISMVLLGGFCLSSTMLLISYAYSYMSPGSVIVLHFSYPVLACVGGALFFGEGFGVKKLLSCALALGGVYLVSGFSGASSPWGPVLALLSAVSYAAYFLAGRHSAYANVETSVTSVYITGSSAVVCLTASALTGGGASADAAGVLPQTAFTLILLVLGGILGYLVGLRLLLYGIRTLGGGNASMLNTLEPVAATLFSMLVFGETLVPLKALGCLLILAAAIITVLGSVKRA